MSTYIELKDLTKVYGTKDATIMAVDNVNLKVKKNDIYGIMGLSGAGKSTLIRLLNRLEEPTSGEIYIDGKDILLLGKTELEKYRQKTGMIFQHFNLLTSRTVAGNIAFALEIARWSKNDIAKRVDELLELVGLEDKKNVYPSQLSGGQKQRVAIARALANKPTILLSDEATSALDPRTTLSILELLKDIQQKMDLTIVLITHQMEVIKKICDRTAIMSEGKIVEEGTTEEIFFNPKEDLTKEFVGHINPDIETKEETGKSRLRLNFLGEEANKSYISDLVRIFGIDVNILGGNIDTLSNVKIGHLLIEVKGDKTDIEKAVNWLKENGVKVEGYKDAN